MIALRDFLDDFSVGPAPLADSVEPGLDAVEAENLRLEAFENGYKAGWDDAVKAQTEDQSSISSGLGQQLQDLSFTYHEAYGQMLNAMTPLLEDMVNKVLPGLAREVLGHQVVDLLRQAASDIGSVAVEVAVAPANMSSVAPLLEVDFGFPVRLVEDDSLSEEQADIRFGESEKQIDLGGLLASVTEAVEGFTHDNGKQHAHG